MDNAAITPNVLPTSAASAGSETLRQLQTRLAQRLRSQEPAQEQWLKLVCGSTGYLAPLVWMGGLLPYPQVLPLPHAKAWVQGLALVSGEAHLVFDINHFVATNAGQTFIPQAAAKRPSEVVGSSGSATGGSAAGLPSHICILGPQSTSRSAFAVTQALGLCTRADFVAAPPTALPHSPSQDQTKGAHDTNRQSFLQVASLKTQQTDDTTNGAASAVKVWYLLDAQALMANPAFAEIEQAYTLPSRAGPNL